MYIQLEKCDSSDCVSLRKSEVKRNAKTLSKKSSEISYQLRISKGSSKNVYFLSRVSTKLTGKGDIGLPFICQSVHPHSSNEQTYQSTSHALFWCKTVVYSGQENQHRTQSPTKPSSRQGTPRATCMHFLSLRCEGWLLFPSTILSIKITKMACFNTSQRFRCIPCGCANSSKEDLYDP